jgi:hypothetical protein
MEEHYSQKNIPSQCQDWMKRVENLCKIELPLRAEHNGGALITSAALLDDTVIFS